MGIIYKATHKINGKKYSYIGQTSRTLEKRKKEHLYKSKFQKAIKKYGNATGGDQFKWTILENNVPEKKLINREHFWIDKLDTIKNGYNVRGMTKIEKKKKQTEKNKKILDFLCIEYK